MLLVRSICALFDSQLKRRTTDATSQLPPCCFSTLRLKWCIIGTLCTKAPVVHPLT